MSKEPPKYSLSDARKAAQKGNVYLDRNAKKDSANLGYSQEDICKCMASLQESDFHKSIDYGPDERTGARIVCDVYKMRFRVNDSRIDDLYIKFRLAAKSHLWIASFKQE